MLLLLQGMRSPNMYSRLAAPPRSKTYWDVEFGPVPGTVQLYLNYTSKATALDGEQLRLLLAVPTAV